MDEDAIAASSSMSGLPSRAAQGASAVVVSPTRVGRVAFRACRASLLPR